LSDFGAVHFSRALFLFQSLGIGLPGLSGSPRRGENSNDL
jgi:hypothetical protein